MQFINVIMIIAATLLVGTEAQGGAFRLMGAFKKGAMAVAKHAKNNPEMSGQAMSTVTQGIQSRQANAQANAQNNQASQYQGQYQGQYPGQPQFNSPAPRRW